MGVTGLWKLIDPCGKPMPIETLEGKILAVDISIWLHQVIKGFQDHKGAALNNAHLLGLFHRVCKLLYYRIKPVFIFDGCVPQLKKDTLARRHQQRSKLNNEAERIHALLLHNLAQEQMVQQALGPNAVDLLLTSPLKRLAAASHKCINKEDLKDDIFKLPDIPEEEEEGIDECLKIRSSEENSKDDSYITEENSSFESGIKEEDSNARYIYNANLQAIDVRSQHFRNLPADIRHEILIDIKETRKQSSWGRLHELPSRGDDFSTFQMKRLLKRRDVQVSLEEAEKDMGGRSLTYAELNDLFTEDGILEPSALSKGTQQLCSDEHTRFLLVKDLKKKLSQDIKLENNNDSKILQTSKETAKMPKIIKSHDKDDNVNDDENDIRLKNDINLAIALSLAEINTPTKVYDAKDYDYESDESIKLTKQQKQQLKYSTKGPARSYMIEYAGMNKDEVDDIMESTQLDPTITTSILEEFLPPTQEQTETKWLESQNDIKLKPKKEIDDNLKTENNEEIVKINKENNDDDTDSDLEEVRDEASASAKTGGLSIVLKLGNNSPPKQEDLFADIFNNTTESLKSPNTKIKNNLNGELDPSHFENVQNNAEHVKSLLNQLKQQVDNVKLIKLDDIKVNNPNILETDNDDCPKNSQKENLDIIEICDSPKSVIQNVDKTVKTPTKNHSINDYYEIDYIIKRSPDKSLTNELTTPQKVTSPFFIKKTPNSKRKNNCDSLSNSPTTVTKKSTNINKKLFKENNKGVTQNDAQQVMKNAIKVLNEKKSNADLESMAESLVQERQNLEQLRNRQERMGLSITQRMTSDCQNLLRLFGIPYLVAPMEAEAQCAFLDAVQLTNGTITDDSDIWLFGGRTVYKNFFDQRKHVLEFQADEIEKNFQCNRTKLIQLACLVGSDYTTGINGIGTVTALEILAQFSHKPPDDKCNDAIFSSSHYICRALEKFRHWWLTTKNSSNLPGSSSRLALQKKLKNIELSEGFPNIAVIEAYLTPTIDDNTEAFSWGQPDVASIREFTRQVFGWTQKKTDDILMPVIKKLNEKKTQSSILKYLKIKKSVNATTKQLAVSKRVKTAIDKMNMNINNSDNDDCNGDNEEKDTKPFKSKRLKKINDCNVTKITNKEKKKRRQTTEPKSINTVTEYNKSTSTRKCTAKKRSSKEVIPQREKDLAQMEAKKKYAAEVLKKIKQQQHATNKQ